MAGGFAGGGDRTLYVGNLPYDATEEEVNELIAATGAGEVARVNLPIDPDGRKRGFGFVTMGTTEGARAALDALNGADMRGRRLIVNIAHPKGEGPPRRDGPRPGPRPGGYGGPSNDAPDFRPMPPPDFGPPPDPARREERRRAAVRPEPDRGGEGKGAKKRKGAPTKERGRRGGGGGGGGGGRWRGYDDDDE